MVASVSPYESRLEEIVRRRREIDAFEAEWLTLIGEYDRSGEWQSDGHGSAAAALRAACRMTAGEAARPSGSPSGCSICRTRPPRLPMGASPARMRL
jgi:hypothetical protein